MVRYGILGGTFDPPHLGHTSLALAAKNSLDLDEVIFVPANKNPLKTRRTTPAKERLKMVELAIQDEIGFSVSDIELTRGGPSYSLDTLEEFLMVQPGDYWFIVGADVLQTLDSWKEPEKLFSLCRFAGVTREGVTTEEVLDTVNREYSRKVDVVTMPNVAVSSSKIREDIIRGAPVEQWLKPAVWEYIKDIGLYRE